MRACCVAILIRRAFRSRSTPSPRHPNAVTHRYTVYHGRNFFLFDIWKTKIDITTATWRPSSWYTHIYTHRYWALFIRNREAFVYYLSEMKLNIDTVLTQSRMEKRTASKWNMSDISEIGASARKTARVCLCEWVFSCSTCSMFIQIICTIKDSSWHAVQNSNMRD